MAEATTGTIFFVLALPILLFLTVAGAEPTRLTKSDVSAISSTIYEAERWLITRLIPHYPTIPITAIVIDGAAVCSGGASADEVVSGARNLYYAFTKWGVENDIKICAKFPTICSAKTSKPLLDFFHEINSFCSDDLKPFLSHSGDASVNVFGARKIMSINGGFSFMPAPESPLAFVPDTSPSEIPVSSPEINGAMPAPPTWSITLPPDYPAISPGVHVRAPPAPSHCSSAPPPVPTTSPSPAPAKGGGPWCVAKPTVPEEKLQKAMEYACGVVGGECKEIEPYGRCYYPDNLVSHASYAFNSYWQKMKEMGGTCDFDGTALLISTDPSYLQCHFAQS